MDELQIQTPTNTAGKQVQSAYDPWPCLAEIWEFLLPVRCGSSGELLRRTWQRLKPGDFGCARLGELGRNPSGAMHRVFVSGWRQCRDHGDCF